MCGRYTLRASARELQQFFELLRAPPGSDRPEIKPTQPVLGMWFDSEARARESRQFRWGLVPAWSRDATGGAPLINARAETLATKPTFRASFQRRRCLIPASGFFEWQAIPGRKKKQPVFIGLRDQPLLGMAGLWDRWSGEGGELFSCTIITTTANAAMAAIHDRMPVILAAEHFQDWLDPEADPAGLASLLRPYPAQEMVLSTQIADDLLADPPTSHQQTLF